MVISTFCTTYYTHNRNIPDIIFPSDDVVNHVTMFGSWMSRGHFVFQFQTEEGVTDS